MRMGPAPGGACPPEVQVGRSDPSPSRGSPKCPLSAQKATRSPRLLAEPMVASESSPLQLRCPSCAEVLRISVPFDAEVHCPSCTESMSLDRPILISGNDFQATVLESPIPVLVDFFAVWCGPCAWIVPTLEEVARAQVGRLLVVKVDTDEAPEWATAHRIHSVPQILRFESGAERDRSIGVEPHRVRQMAEPGA
jgi:thioredoxin